MDTLSKSSNDGTKTIFGQAYIVGDSLVQDQMLLAPGGILSNNTVVLIKDIWEDLQSETGKVKSNSKGYFYWEVTMTSSENDDVNLVVRVEAPRPKPGLWGEDLSKVKANSEWAKWWLKKAQGAANNYEKEYAIQKKHITLAGTSYISQTGSTITLEDKVVQNNGLGDIENLLTIF